MVHNYVTKLECLNTYLNMNEDDIPCIILKGLLYNLGQHMSHCMDFHITCRACVQHLIRIDVISSGFRLRN